MLPVDSTSIRKAQQAYANVIYHGTGNLAYGFEYHYLDREVWSGSSADNHRFMFVLMAGTARADRQPGSTGAEMAQRSTFSEMRDAPVSSPGTMYLKDL